MFKTALALFACLALLGTAPAFAAPAIGEEAPDFEALDIDGNAVKLSDYRGRHVVLEWTDGMCPCVARHYKTGNMQKLQKHAAANGVVWLTISSSAPGKPGHMSVDEAKARQNDFAAAPTAFILDESGKIGHAFGAKTTPHMFVVDAQGRLAYSGAIDSESDYEIDPSEADNYVLAALEHLAAGEPVAIPETKPYGCGVKY
ncbi:MAG: redoxin domain-containing protein [Alphaproteobacteria bacterium]|nr:redoxin domain-containing protein [Alphaproteobacteria bacterium]